MQMCHEFRKKNRPDSGIDDGGAPALCLARNIRELEHVIERAVILTEGSSLEPIEFSTGARGGGAVPSVMTLEERERRHIMDILEQTGWRVSGKDGAAELLGLKPTTLEARMKKLGITRKK